jgi:hypothetical protein
MDSASRSSNEGSLNYLGVGRITSISISAYAPCDLSMVLGRLKYIIKHMTMNDIIPAAKQRRPMLNPTK